MGLKVAVVFGVLAVGLRMPAVVWGQASGAAAAQAAKSAEPEPAWEADLHRRHEELVKRNGPGPSFAISCWR